MSRDWRQVGPVVPFGTADDVVDAALISSYLWKHVKRFRLTQSMRDRLHEPYSKAVRAIGEGRVSPITLPDKSELIPLQYTTSTATSDSHPSTSTVQGVTDFQHLIDLVYPDLLIADPTLFADRGILAPTNVSIDEINDHILNLLQNTRSLLSSNSIIKSNPNDIAEVILSELLQAADVPGVPSHNLRLKVGCVVMFMRNVNFDTGIVNGEEGVVRAISIRIVDVEVIAPDSPLIKIPRILFEVQVGSKGITFHCRQFPLRVCYAVTVNKSQGQTLSKVGLDL